MPLPRSTYRTTIFDFFPPGVKWLLIINTGVFLLHYLGGGFIAEQMNVVLALYAEAAVRTLFVWQIFTYMFLHGGFGHLLFNMLTLWMFGTQLEREWGTRRFLKYYFYCGMAAGVCVLLVNIAFGDWRTITIGASGAIFGLLVAFGVLYPNQTVLMNFLFPIKAKYMVMIYAAIELIMTFGPNTGISTIAHLGGMAFGYVYLKGRLPSFNLGMGELRGHYRRWQMQRAKKKFQVYMKKRGNGPFVN